MVRSLTYFSPVQMGEEELFPRSTTAFYGVHGEGNYAHPPAPIWWGTRRACVRVRLGRPPASYPVCLKPCILSKLTVNIGIMIYIILL